MFPDIASDKFTGIDILLFYSSTNYGEERHEHAILLKASFQGS
jgi:hypothetical protein